MGDATPETEYSAQPESDPEFWLEAVKPLPAEKGLELDPLTMAPRRNALLEKAAVEEVEMATDPVEGPPLPVAVASPKVVTPETS